MSSATHCDQADQRVDTIQSRAPRDWATELVRVMDSLPVADVVLDSEIDMLGDAGGVADPV